MICNAHCSSSSLSSQVLRNFHLIWAVLVSSQRTKQVLSAQIDLLCIYYIYIYIYIYIYTKQTNIYIYIYVYIYLTIYMYIIYIYVIYVIYIYILYIYIWKRNNMKSISNETLNFFFRKVCFSYNQSF